jgi:hypothetical protein
VQNDGDLQDLIAIKAKSGGLNINNGKRGDR